MNDQLGNASPAAEPTSRDANRDLPFLRLAVSAFCLVLLGLALVRWFAWSYGADSGTFAQMIADPLHGFPNSQEHGSHFRFHWSPILALLWPISLLPASALVLQAVQIALIGGSILLYGNFLRGALGTNFGARVAALALLYPAVYSVAFTDFHEIAFYPLIAFGLLMTAQNRRYGFCALFVCLSGLVREDASISFVCVGIFLLAVAGHSAWQKSRVTASAAGRNDHVPHLLWGESATPRALAIVGVSLILWNVVTLWTYFHIVITQLGPWKPAGNFYHYSFAVGPVATLVGVIQQPGHLREVFTIGKCTYLLELLAPLLALPLASPWFVLALPGLTTSMLASNPLAWHAGTHYSALFLPWLLVGFAHVMGAIARRSPRRARSAQRMSLAIMIGFFCLANPMHLGHYLRATEGRAEVSALYPEVPAGATVAMHDEWFSHLAYRNQQAQTSVTNPAEYVLYDEQFPNADFAATTRPGFEHLIQTGGASIIDRRGSVVLLHLRRPVILR